MRPNAVLFTADSPLILTCTNVSIASGNFRIAKASNLSLSSVKTYIEAYSVSGEVKQSHKRASEVTRCIQSCWKPKMLIKLTTSSTSNEAKFVSPARSRMEETRACVYKRYTAVLPCRRETLSDVFLCQVWHKQTDLQVKHAVVRERVVCEPALCEQLVLSREIFACRIRQAYRLLCKSAYFTAASPGS